jgi:outer membrane receptor protein involved in Fe transport
MNYNFVPFMKQIHKFFLLIFCFFALQGFGQKMTISGTAIDTIEKVPLKYAIATAIRVKDSILVAYARSDENGRFELKNLPIDTVQVTVSHPKFGEQTYYIFGSANNHEFDFGKIILPPKSLQLNEVVIYAFKDPVYYKGDTLVYTADSFKVKPNATVEDLLKKLPGMRVDAEGKITSQGKAIDQVLVDGDEFFGTDPTVATKNLAANGVESVQVYEKKNENTSDDSKETIQVMNLKLKDEAKKGYFGKISGASDFQKFYEGEFLANRFKSKQKLSVFALGSNTPRSSFGWGDMYKYGLDDQMNTQTDDDGTTYYFGNNNQPQGIPQTLKSGFYYSDKLSKNTKINFNYSYSNNILKAGSSTHSQYFLNDSSYVTDNISEKDQRTEGHSVNFGITQVIDSLTDLEITPKFQFNTNNTKASSITDFLTTNDTLTRRTEVMNANAAQGYNINTIAKLNRRFKKKDRLLILTYNLILKNDESKGTLKSNDTFYSNLSIPSDSINQKKINTSEQQNHSAKLVYTEPLTKKTKLEFEYTFNSNMTQQNKQAFNYYNGEYSVNDSSFSNNFKNSQMINKAGLKFTYETKKLRFAFGSRVQQREVISNNLVTNQKFSQSGNSALPYLNFMYRFTDNKRLNFSYSTFATQPAISQLQPVPDNTNPNRIVIGNADLKQAYQNKFELSYNSWKPITGRYFWGNLNYGITNNGFSNSTYYDSIGRTISKTVNVDDNYYLNGYAGGGVPLFSKLINLNPSVNFNSSKNSNFINSQKNKTTQNSVGLGLDIDVELDTLTFQVGVNYDYNTTQSTLNNSSNKPYSSQKYTAEISLKLPFKFFVESDVAYNVNSQRTPGYNINYVLWNASINKKFLKNENLIISLIGNDLLNQNISTNRTIEDNIITDTKTNIISRYFLLKAVFKFNNTRTKDNDDFGM